MDPGGTAALPTNDGSGGVNPHGGVGLQPARWRGVGRGCDAALLGGGMGAQGGARVAPDNGAWARGGGRATPTGGGSEAGGGGASLPGSDTGDAGDSTVVPEGGRLRYIIQK